MLDALKKLERHYKDIELQLADPSVLQDQARWARLNKERSRLVPMMGSFRRYQEVLQEWGDLEEIKKGSDEALKEMAQADQQRLLQERLRLEKELKRALRPPDPNDDKDIIVEIRAGTGGDEAALFVGDLYRMYTRFAERQGWKIEAVSSNPTGLGGFKEVIFTVSGAGVWRAFKFERGIHRVQRVPVTEASGRIHTSAVSVAVLPEADEIDLTIDPKDLKIDTYRASGAGGQHVNKTESAIRITHLPTGFVVACQDERSQLKNRMKAMKLLRSRLLAMMQESQEKAISQERKMQVGSGDRSEKIRTYNFPQDRITDHRIHFTLHHISDVLEGHLDPLVEALQEHEEKMALHE